jgi:predicted aspartyl protease
MTCRCYSLILSLFLQLWIAPLAAEDKSSPIIVRANNPGELLSIKGELNGIFVNCIIDTGASHHVIDSHLKCILGTLQKSQSDGNFELSSPQQLLINGLSDEVNVGSVVLDLSPFSEKSGIAIDMFVGMPFLFNRVIQIDPYKRRFFLSVEPPDAQGDCLQLEFDELARPYVSVGIGDHAFLAMVDTGSTSDITLTSELFQLVRQKNSKKEIESRRLEVQSVSGREVREVFVASNVRIGNTVVAECEVMQASLNKIGLKFLSRFVSTIDLKNEKLTLSSR